MLMLTMKLLHFFLVCVPLGIAALPTPDVSGYNNVHEIQRRQSTRNELDDGGCKDMIVVFARGTTEGGNVGTLAGPPFFDAIMSKVGSSATVAVQGVEYPASIPGFLAGGDKAGSQTMYVDTSSDAH